MSFVTENPADAMASEISLIAGPTLIGIARPHETQLAIASALSSSIAKAFALSTHVTATSDESGALCSTGEFCSRTHAESGAQVGHVSGSSTPWPA
ncbi:hypothetical protein VHN57_17140 [Sphingobium sp. WW5]|uniref:hypothetical protein n=1 Tax=unclassified Sphingobium TaxID=2611147 RepID=UPI003C00CD58